MAELTYLGSLDSEKWLGIPGFTDFRPVLFVTKCHTENSSQISHLCRSFFWLYSFSRHLRFMTTGDDRNKDRFKSLKLCGLWILPFRNHGAIKLTQNCVCFTNPCINLFVPTSVTLEYHPKVLECLHQLRCISTHLQNTLSWALGVLRYTIPQCLQCWFLFLLGRTQHKTDQKHAEDPAEKIHPRTN